MAENKEGKPQETYYFAGSKPKCPQVLSEEELEEIKKKRLQGLLQNKKT